MTVTVLWITRWGLTEWSYRGAVEVYEEPDRLVIVFARYTLRLFTYHMAGWSKSNAEDNAG